MFCGATQAQVTVSKSTPKIKSSEAVEVKLEAKQITSLNELSLGEKTILQSASSTPKSNIKEIRLKAIQITQRNLDSILKVSAQKKAVKTGDNEPTLVKEIRLEAKEITRP